MSNPTAATEQDVRKLGHLIRGIQVAFLTTVADDGTLHARPMATQHTDFDGTLWFFTREHSTKVDEVNARQQVGLTYADPHEQTYVAISGTAEVVDDDARKKELWHPLLKAWFPKGLSDPELALLKVTVERAEYWDAYNSTFVHLVGFAKALVTGEPYAPGEHKSLTLERV